ncbi:MAG: aminopeptidase P family protein [Clostridiales bacterium]|nr:aminopeptidase P family protein [Clostridiales bacterium]
MKHRINNFFESVSLKEHEGYFVSNESNVTYMSGFTGEASYLILSSKGQVLMTDGRYDAQAQMECEHFEVTKWHNPTRPDPETIIFYLKKYEIKTLYFNENSLAYKHYRVLYNALKHHEMNVELVPISGLIEALREVKEASEIECIKIACDIADKALESLVPHIKIGVTELQLVAQLEYYLKSYGADNISFDTIILSGDKTAMPHGKPSDKKLEKGDFLQVDFGALYKGYHSDMSRTFIIGEASEKQIALYDMLLKATVDSTAVLQGGIKAAVPDAKVREILDDEATEYYYPGLGHGVGLDIHEGPSMSITSKDDIRTNNVVTIEPGVYIAGWGGMRIEDTIVVTEDGYEVLTKYPRALQVLG